MNGDVITDDVRVSIEDNRELNQWNLKITNLTHSDTATYVCQAFFKGIGIYTYTVNVTIGKWHRVYSSYHASRVLFFGQ